MYRCLLHKKTASLSLDLVIDNKVDWEKIFVYAAVFDDVKSHISFEG